MPRELGRILLAVASKAVYSMYICRKYQDRDDIKDGNKCLQALDDLIAEVSAKLEEYNIDVTPTVSVGVHQAEAMACFTGHANVVIGPEWNQDSQAVVHAAGTKKKYTPLSRNDMAKYTPAPKYSKLKCGNVNCDTLLSALWYSRQCPKTPCFRLIQL